MIPVEPAVLGAFALAAGAVVISPGPDTLLVVRYALSSGHRVGMATVAGVQLGLLVHTLLAVAGVSLIIASSPVLFKAVAVAGAAYLAWLGVQGLRGGGRLGLGNLAAVGRAKACRDAMVTNLLNPKVIVVFLALFPNFVDTGRADVTLQLLTLAATLVVINVAWQGPIAWATQAARRWLLTPTVAGAIARGTGVVLLVFAALMLYQHLV